MIRLKPIPDAPHECPRCRINLQASGWLITGMRNLAELRCPQCENEFYGDMPAGQALYTPILLDKSTGAIYDRYDAGWFSEWLADSYRRRTDKPLDFRVKKLSEVKNKVVLLNCLDALYGHSLLKLLNAQSYINRPDASLIVLIPSFLEWMLPVGAAEAWIVDLPLRRGTEWNDWLAGEINERLGNFAEVFLSVAFSHPSADDFEIEKFTKVTPFPLDQWKRRLANPRVTFIWRDDRLWENEADESLNRFGKIKRRFGRRERQTNDQRRRVVRLAERLRGELPALDFAVAGMGEAEGLPGWISDLRLKKPDAAEERAWCERYAQSHVVVGVHGSNMLLPSAHAGALVELIGEDRWGNFLQDVLFRPADAREMFFRYRFAPPSIAPDKLARLIVSMLRYEDFRQLMSPEFGRRGENRDFVRRLPAPRREIEQGDNKI